MHKNEDKFEKAKNVIKLSGMDRKAAFWYAEFSLELRESFLFRKPICFC